MQTSSLDSLNSFQALILFILEIQCKSLLILQNKFVKHFLLSFLLVCINYFFILFHSVLNPSYTSATGIAIIVICAVGIFFCILMTILIFSYRHLKPIMISSPVFCYLELLGTIVCYLSALLSLGKPNPPICIARAICLFTGFILVVGSIIAKNYRIYKM